MWPFDRNKQKDSNGNAVPTEIKKYYQAEKRERTGIAWLLGIATLLITMALAVLLFFGGRWVFRTLFDNDDKGIQVAQNSPSPTPAAATVAPEATATPAPSATPTPVPSATPTPNATPTPKPSVTPTPKKAATDDGLPHTGPEDTLAVFVIVVALGTAGHAMLQRKRVSDLGS